MSMKCREQNVDEKIEFDIIVGGKYKERVSHGVLIGLSGSHASQIATSCSVMGMMSAYYALKTYVESNDDLVKLMAEFEKFKESVSPDIEKMVDELRAKVNEGHVEETD